MVFVLARIAHVIGMGFIPPSANKPRVWGTIATALVGTTTGALLVWQVAALASG